MEGRRQKSGGGQEGLKGRLRHGPSQQAAIYRLRSSLRVPLPGGLNDFIQAGVLWFPCQYSPGQGGVGHKYRRITSPARSIFSGGLRAAGASHGGNYLADRMPVSSSKVQRIALAALQQVLQRSYMRLRKVCHVDIIADGRAIRSGIIRPVNLNRVTLALSGRDHQWNQVRFR